MKTVALPSYPLRLLHLVAVWAYAVSQPVFSLLDANPEFLVVRGSSRFDVILFACLLALAPPILAVGSELAVRVVTTRVADLLHLVFLGAFALPLALQLLRVIDPIRVFAILGAAIIAVSVVVAYSRFRAARLFLTFSLALPLVGFFSFVWSVPLATTDDVPRVNLKIPVRTPVVVLVLDELPISSLLSSDGSIDKHRYPSFARLARDGTWYPAATTVHEYTTHAVPAILDGRMPARDSLPTLDDHPRNLFTLLGESYDFQVIENITHLCPSRYCAGESRGAFARRLQSLFADVRIAYLDRTLPTSLAHGVSAMDDHWGALEDHPSEARAHEVNRSLSDSTGAPRRDFDRFVSSIRRGERARTLHFMHTILPHSPWRFLPSGREYGNADVIDGAVRDPVTGWEDDPWLVQQGYQRHLLQVGYTDRALGRVLDRLLSTGLYERALVVVTADHGVGFVAGETRRTVSGTNIADIAPVPLLIKFPGQKKRRVDRRPARTIDVLPTIADVLGISLPWAMDGRSLLTNDRLPSTVVVMKRDGTRVQAGSSEIERGVAVTLRAKSVLFGEGRDSLHEIGLNRRLLGLPIAGMRVQGSSKSLVDFDNEELLLDVDLSSSFVPARITGIVEGTEIPEETELAVAVNGRIAALTRCFARDGKQRFSALVPETMFRDGFNRVELFSIEGAPSAPRLLRLGESDASEQLNLVSG